jgi:hypothetical protein
LNDSPRPIDCHIKHRVYEPVSGLRDVNSSFSLLHSSFPHCVAGEYELSGQEQPALELSGIRAGGFGYAQNAEHGG